MRDYNFKKIRESIKSDSIYTLMYELEGLYNLKDNFSNDSYMYSQLNYISTVLDDLDNIIEYYINAKIDLIECDDFKEGLEGEYD